MSRGKARASASDEDIESSFIWAIRSLDRAAVHARLADGVTQHLLDCGLHEVATGDREDEASMTLRVEIARMLVECGADPDNRQHGCGGTPLHHTLAGGYLELAIFLLDSKASAVVVVLVVVVISRPRPKPWR